MANFSDRIHAALRGVLVAFPFPAVDYPAGVRTTSASVSAVPQTILIHDDSQSFIPSPNYKRRGVPRERKDWVWLARVGFDRPVSLEEFEATMIAQPLKVLRDPLLPTLREQVTIELHSANYDAPPEQQPSSGTRATFRFVASLTPI